MSHTRMKRIAYFILLFSIGHFNGMQIHASQSDRKKTTPPPVSSSGLLQKYKAIKTIGLANGWDEQTFGSTYREQLLNKKVTEEFLVNDDVTGRSNQRRPSIASDGVGNFVVAWEDYRNGSSDIYFQRYDAGGNELGPSQRANDDEGIATQGYLSMTMNTGGDFVIVWEDGRDGQLDIYFQRFTADGTPQGKNQRANTAGLPESQWDPAVAINSEGQFCITWADYRRGQWDIYLQIYDATGTLLGDNQRANDDEGYGNQQHPRLTWSPNREWGITWSDGRNNNWDIYFQRFSETGNALGINHKVNDDAGSAEQLKPTIASTDNGDFIIAWQDERNGQRDVYFQRYDSSGTKKEPNQQAGDDVSGSRQDSPSVTMDANGGFIITWEDEREDDDDVFLQRFDPDGKRIGTNARVNQTSRGEQEEPIICMDADSHFHIVWEDSRDGDWDIYFRSFDNAGIPQHNDIKSNDDTGTSYQYHSSVAVDAAGRFVIAWEDERNGHWDAYYQRYDATGIPIGSNMKANDDLSEEDQVDPSAAMHPDGAFVIAWEDDRHENHDIFFQRYNSDGSVVGNNVKVNTDAGTAMQLEPSISMDENGRFIIAWDDYRENNANVYFQQFDASGLPVGGNRRANQGPGDHLFQGLCNSVSDAAGNFIIVWWDYRHGNGDVYFQRFDSDGNALDQNQKANDVSGIAWQHWISYPAIVMDASGQFIIAWQDTRNDQVDIYFQRYDAAGNPLGSNEKASGDGETDKYNPWIVMHPDGQFIITWEDWQWGWLEGWEDWVTGQPDIIIQKFNSDGSKKGPLLKLVDDGPHHLERVPIAAADSDKIIFSWEDNRRSMGPDIYAKIIPWDWTGETLIDNNNSVSVDEFNLGQNYPNPFNPVTTIQFIVKERTNVHLVIFDMRGREIKILLDETRKPGFHQIQFHAQDLPSGLYFYRIQMNNFVDVKKMLLLE